MRILVIDDNAANLASARQTLKDHEVVTAQTVEEAWEHLKETWDVVLSDLWMPLPPARKSESYPRDPPSFLGCLYSGDPALPGRMQPVGTAIALVALARGAKAVGILTDSDHHNDPYVRLLDPLQGYEATCKYIHKMEARDACREDIVLLGDEVVAITGGESPQYVCSKGKGNCRFVKDWNKLLDEIEVKMG